jgi:hypothetical protein
MFGAGRLRPLLRTLADDPPGPSSIMEKIKFLMSNGPWFHRHARVSSFPRAGRGARLDGVRVGGVHGGGRLGR